MIKYNSEYSTKFLRPIRKNIENRNKYIEQKRMSFGRGEYGFKGLLCHLNQKFRSVKNFAFCFAEIAE